MTIRGGLGIALLCFIVITVACIAPLHGAAPATQNSSGAREVSLMWKGSELWQFGGGKYVGKEDKWKGMSGSIIGLRYSGKGPLPAPKEFVIPLSKPLPMGSYRLFVKNFYVGAMEATLGDITHPLRIRRYDWTPGQLFETNAPIDRITLRYLPATIHQDTGAPQNQPYIVQGVFLTNVPSRVPIRDGKIVSAAEDQPPQAISGNCLQNGSFETGVYPWGRIYGGGRIIQAENLDSTTAADGSTSLGLSLPTNGTYGVESRSYRLPPGEYTLSFAAKASKAISLTAMVQGLSEDLKASIPSGVRKVVNLNDQWTRYTVSGSLRAMPGFLYSVRLGGRDLGASGVTLWLDAISLEPGKTSEYHAGSPAEVGCISKKPGNIFYQGEPANVELLTSVAAGMATPQVSYQTVDYWGNGVDHGTIAAQPRQTFKLFASRTGLFRTTFTIAASSDAKKVLSQSEFLYSVLPPNAHLDVFYPEGSLATDASFVPQQLEILKRANFNWVNTKFLGRWSMVETQEGKYQFNDAGIAAVRDSHMCVLIQPANQVREAPAWLKPYCKPRGGAVWEPEKKAEYLRRWGEYVYQLVDHYKADVHDWEIENEPNAGYRGEEYADILKAASKAVRRADPKAHVIAFAGGGYNVDFYNTVLAMVDPGIFDVFSVHFYGNQTDRMEAFAKMTAHYGKPGWNTETGLTCPTFFNLLPDYNVQQLADEDLAREHLMSLHTLAVHSVENFLLSRSVARMDRWFNYFSRGGNGSPSEPTARFGNGEEITEYDGSLRANAVGLSIASHFVDGATVDRAIHHGDLIFYLFKRGNECTGWGYSATQHAVKLEIPKGASPTLTFWDMMGNTIDGPQIEVGDSPIYFTFDGSADEAQKLLQSP